MVVADWIAIAVIVGLALFGALLGFGKGLKLFTSGIFGIIISVFLCYCFGGIILKIPFVQQLLIKFAELWTTKEGLFYDFLAKIHVEIIVYYIVLFIVAQIVRIILVRVLKHVFEIKFVLIKIINKVLGMALFVGMGILLALFVFQIVYWVQGETGTFYGYFADSKFLGELYRHNPLSALMDQVKGVIAAATGNFN